MRGDLFCQEGSVILSGAKDLKLRNWRSFAVFAAQDDASRHISWESGVYWRDCESAPPSGCSELARVRNRGVGHCDRRRSWNRARHIGDAVMNDAVDFVHRIRGRRGSDRRPRPKPWIQLWPALQRAVSSFFVFILRRGRSEAQSSELVLATPRSASGLR